MQPFQYNLRCSAAKGDSITHAPVMPRNLDAAITLRFVAPRGQPASLSAHGNTTWQQSCSHSTAICNQEFKNRKELRTTTHHPLQNTEEEPISPERPQPHPSHTRGTFHRRPGPLYPKKHKVSCPGFLPKRSPCDTHAAITMHFAICSNQPASIYAHRKTTLQHYCSHSNAICDQELQNTL